MRIWALRAGNASQVDHIFLHGNQVALGFGAVPDARSIEPTRQAYRTAIASANSQLKAGAIPVWAGQLYRFVHEVKVGDRVIYPRKIDRTIRWGEITGDYLFDRAGSEEFCHRRAVTWRAQRDRDVFSQGALYEIGSTLSLFEVKNFAEEFLASFEAKTNSLAGKVIAPDADETSELVAKDIVETTRDFISKRLKTDLKGVPLEGFVADLFRAMGYRAHTTRAFSDQIAS